MQGSILIVIDRPGLTTPVERELRNRIAWEGVIAILLVITRAWDLRVERVDSVRLGSHERRARIDDGFKPGRNLLVVESKGCTADLPELIVHELVILDRTGVETRVCSADVQLGAGGGELKAKDALGDGTLVNSSIEEGILFDVTWVMRVLGSSQKSRLRS